MDDRTLDAYLARIGATRADTLVELHERHVAAVPFENLGIHLGEEIVLDEDLLVDKIVNRGRGGFCYELNGAFAALLKALGYDVQLLSAKVFNDGAYGPPFDHLALRVGDALVDVGITDIAAERARRRSECGASSRRWSLVYAWHVVM